MVLVLGLSCLFAILVWNAVTVPDTSVEFQIETLPTPSPQRQMPEASWDQPAEIRRSGVTRQDQATGKAQAAEAHDNRVHLVLRGTFSSADSSLAYAIIADPSGREEHYTVGDPVPGGIIVHEIMADKVILAHNEYYETLRLLPDGSEDMVIMQARLTSVDVSSGETNFNNGPVFKERLKSLIDLVHPQPVRMDGRLIGFRLKPLKNDHPLYKYGLRQNDIVTWINEVDLDNPMKVMRILRNISSGDYVNMTVRRDGQDISLSFHMPQ